MSDYGYVADRARRAAADAARAERTLARNPQSLAAQLNYASRRKLAAQSRDEMLRLAEINNIEVCNYRIISKNTDYFPLASVSKSCLSYQYLFSQVHDAVRNGKKNNAVIGSEALAESSLGVAYTYPGSLGVILLAESEPGFFSGSLDDTISAFFRVIRIRSLEDIRLVSDQLGNAVLKRVKDWSEANSQGGFSVDLQWKRSDGISLGGVFEKEEFELLIELIGDISDESREDRDVQGLLVGIDLKSGTFHISVEDGADLRGSFAEAFDRSVTVEVGIRYNFSLTEITKMRYATGEVSTRYELDHLDPL